MNPNRPHLRDATRRAADHAAVNPDPAKSVQVAEIALRLNGLDPDDYRITVRRPSEIGATVTVTIAGVYDPTANAYALAEVTR